MLGKIMNHINTHVNKNGTPHIEIIKSSEKQQNKTLNIFVHGYSALKDENDRHKILSKLSVNTLDDNWLFSWPSGFFVHPILQNISFTDVLVVIKGSAFAKGLAILQAQKAMFAHFKKYLAEAENIGKTQFIDTILQELNKNNCSYDQINIIGHSLGARLVCFGLLHTDRDKISKLRVHHLYLLAGATPIDMDWLSLSTRLDGNIYNFYSSKDFVLILKPDKEKCIGRYPVCDPDVSKDRLINIETNIAHWRYWDEISKVFELSK
jgi:hypothetical protein